MLQQASLWPWDAGMVDILAMCCRGLPGRVDEAKEAGLACERLSCDAEAEGRRLLLLLLLLLLGRRGTLACRGSEAALLAAGICLGE